MPAGELKGICGPAKAEEHDRRGIYLGGIVYSSYIVFFFLTSCLPALFLNIYLRKRINSLEKGLCESIAP